MSQLFQKSYSQFSRSRSGVSQLNDLEELTDDELVRQVNELKEQVTDMKLENEVIEKSILRLDPSLMHGVNQAIEYANRIQSNLSITGSFIRSQTSKLCFDSLASPSRLLSSPSKVSARRVESTARMSGKSVILGTGKRVNVLERSELVNTEMQIIMNLLEKARNKADKKHNLLKAQLEELDERVANIQKSVDLFKQVVITEGVDPVSQRIPAEIWTRYMSEWLKDSESIIGKYRLRTSTLNSQYSKLKSQINMKQELSESLRPVDFEKLQIQNSECLGVIDKKLVHLGELKKMTGDANLTLTIHKNLMMDQNIYLKGVLNMIKRRERETVLIDKERDEITDQVDKLEVTLDDVKKTRLTYEVPDIMDYVQIKAELHDLKNGMKYLKNKNHLQQITLSSVNKRLKSLSMEM